MKRRFVSYERVAASAARGLLEGWARQVPTPDGRDYRMRYVVASLEMDCENPYSFEVYGVTRKIQDRKIMTMLIHSRCRKCGMCQLRRGRYWAAKAVDEFNRWPRTLLGTFTMSVETHEMFDLRIDTGEGGRPRENLNLLTADERFAARVSVIGDELTKYIKRIRKSRGSDFRYLLIAEAHDSEATDDRLKGRPHFHILFHEKKVGALTRGDPREAMLPQYGHLPGYEWELRYVKVKGKWSERPYTFLNDDAFLRTEWEFGFTKFQLAETANSAVYPCKYLTKAMKARVRCSNGYGGQGGEVPVGGGLPPALDKGSEATETAAYVVEQKHDHTEEKTTVKAEEGV